MGCYHHCRQQDSGPSPAEPRAGVVVDEFAFRTVYKNEAVHIRGRPGGGLPSIAPVRSRAATSGEQMSTTIHLWAKHRGDHQGIGTRNMRPLGFAAFKLMTITPRFIGGGADQAVIGPESPLAH